MRDQEVRGMLEEIIAICDKDADPILCLIAIKRVASSRLRFIANEGPIGDANVVLSMETRLPL